MSEASTDSLDVQLLEPLLQSFVALTGLRATMLIVEAFGGRPIYVAKDPDPDGNLARLVGLDAAIVLGCEYGGNRLTIPKAGAALRALRDQRIRAEHAHKSLSKLVQDYSLSERRICEILTGADPDLGSLFD